MISNRSMSNDKTNVDFSPEIAAARDAAVRDAADRAVQARDFVTGSGEPRYGDFSGSEADPIVFGGGRPAGG